MLTYEALNDASHQENTEMCGMTDHDPGEGEDGRANGQTQAYSEALHHNAGHYADRHRHHHGRGR